MISDHSFHHSNTPCLKNPAKILTHFCKQNLSNHFTLPVPILLDNTMHSENNCPICTRSYNNRLRKEMMVCLNQHFICLECANQIYGKNAKCPFCKDRFSINRIRPRRIPHLRTEVVKVKQSFMMKALCPAKHRNGKFTFCQKTCNKCGKRSIAQWRCLICRYALCWSCIQPAHDEICSGTEWTYDQAKEGCSICGEIVRGGRNCGKCSMRICHKHDSDEESQNSLFRTAVEIFNKAIREFQR